MDEVHRVIVRVGQGDPRSNTYAYLGLRNLLASYENPPRHLHAELGYERPSFHFSKVQNIGECRLESNVSVYRETSNLTWSKKTSETMINRHKKVEIEWKSRIWEVNIGLHAEWKKELLFTAEESLLMDDGKIVPLDLSSSWKLFVHWQVKPSCPGFCRFDAIYIS